MSKTHLAVWCYRSPSLIMAPACSQNHLAERWTDCLPPPPLSSPDCTPLSTSLSGQSAVPPGRAQLSLCFLQLGPQTTYRECFCMVWLHEEVETLTPLSGLVLSSWPDGHIWLMMTGEKGPTGHSLPACSIHTNTIEILLNTGSYSGSLWSTQIKYPTPKQLLIGKLRITRSYLWLLDSRDFIIKLLICCKMAAKILAPCYATS